MINSASPLDHHLDQEETSPPIHLFVMTCRNEGGDSMVFYDQAVHVRGCVLVPDWQEAIQVLIGLQWSVEYITPDYAVLHKFDSPDNIPVNALKEIVV